MSSGSSTAGALGMVAGDAGGAGGADAVDGDAEVGELEAEGEREAGDGRPWPWRSWSGRSCRRGRRRDVVLMMRPVSASPALARARQCLAAWWRRHPRALARAPA